MRTLYIFRVVDFGGPSGQQGSVPRTRSAVDPITFK